MLKFFRGISILEGLSFLLILCVSLNIINREFVQILGMSHGILFMIYLVFSFITGHKQGWSLAVSGLILLASLIPFAFIAVDFFLQNELRKEQEVSL